MKDFLKKLVGFSLGPIIGAVIGFITIPITTYFIVPEEYGKASMFTLIYTIITAVVYLGLDQAYARFYHEVGDKKKLLYNSLIFPFLLSIFIAAILIINPGFVSNILFDSNIYVLPIYLLVIMVPLVVLERFLLLSIRMEEKALKYSLFNIFLKLMIFLVTLVFILKIRRDFLAIVYSTIIGQIIGDVVLAILCKKKISFNIKLFDKELLKSILKFGLPLSIVWIIAWALNSIDRVFLRIFTNFDEIGYYTVAMKVTSILLIIQSSFCTFWVPTAYRWNKEGQNNQKFSLVSNTLSLSMGILFIGILLFKELIPIVISQSYSRAIYIVPFLLFYPIMYAMSETTTLGIVFSKKSYLNLIVSILSIIINVILNIVLVPRIGAVGAAIALGVAYIVFFWTRTVISRRLWYKFPLKQYIYVTIILFICAIINSYKINNIIVTIVNLLGIGSIIYVYRNTIKYFLDKIKNRRIVEVIEEKVKN